MFKIGFNSGIFTNLSVEGIINLAKTAGFTAVEWSGDIHIPIDDAERAAGVRRMMETAGLETCLYSTYFRFGNSTIGFDTYRKILNTAKALGSKAVRIYIGNTGPKYINEEAYKKILLETKINTEFAKKQEIGVVTEFYNNTLTESNESALKFMQEINSEQASLLWQPSQLMDPKERLSGIQMLLPYISHVRTYHTIHYDKLPLSDGKSEWNQFVSEFKKSTRDIYFIIDHVKDAEELQLSSDLEILKNLLK